MCILAAVSVVAFGVVAFSGSDFVVIAVGGVAVGVIVVAAVVFIRVVFVPFFGFAVVAIVAGGVARTICVIVIIRIVLFAIVLVAFAVVMFVVVAAARVITVVVGCFSLGIRGTWGRGVGRVDELRQLVLHSIQFNQKASNGFMVVACRKVVVDCSWLCGQWGGVCFLVGVRGQGIKRVNKLEEFGVKCVSLL